MFAGHGLNIELYKDNITSGDFTKDGRNEGERERGKGRGIDTGKEEETY